MARREEYERSRRLEEIAGKLIESEPKLGSIGREGIRIGYQYSNQKKLCQGKTKYADTMVVREKLKEFLPIDFIITFYEPNCAALDDEHLSRVMYHELLHVGFDGLGRFWVAPHDVEDFRECIERWGLDWLWS